ncbi:MAG: hypothetical protein HKN21_01370, partial [Candidatus Eisenbacteria bacterium]|nr:hypothetical protein [Candidatus Eisenbacteria bacterium]
MRLVASFALLLFLTFSLTAPAEAQECCSYSIEGFVFADLNADGIMNGADYGLVGWTVEAFNLTTGTAFASAVTGPGGYYLFPPSAVLPCTSPYGLREVVQSPWIQTSPTNPNFLTLSLGACDNSVFGPFNFGNCGDAYKLYTLDADFNQGNLNGLITNSDQLEISPTPTTFGFGWIANADEGTISKIDMATGNELARYYTGPPDGAGKYAYLYPSRTVVDEDGNCWVANRTGSGRLPSVTQILANGAIDLNGDNQLTTSGDCCPADGQITLGTAEILPWGQDEAVIRHYQIGTTVNNFARGLAIDKGGFLWVGLSSDLRIAKLRPDHPTAIYGSHQPQTTVPEEASVPLCTQPNSCQVPYGIALSPNGFLYVSTIGSLAFEIDPGLNSGGTAAGPAVTQNYINHGPDRNYGIAVDQDCIVWLAKYGGSPGSTQGCIRWDPTVGVNNPALGFTNSVGTTQGGGRGITVDFNGDIWMATNDTDGVTKFNNANPPVVLGNYGTAII